MKKAQVTVFIIIAIIIVATFILLFALRKELFPSTQKIIEKFRPFSDSYSLCLKELGEEAVNILGVRGGFIFLPEREKGGKFMPFGSALYFLGDEIPYWFYISANGIERQNIPSKQNMENQIETYVEENIERCNSVIEQFREEGFEIEELGKVRVRARINDEEVSLRIIRPLKLKLKNSFARVDSYGVKIKKSVGRVYENARKIMEAENNKLFLEERTIDIFSLYNELPSTRTTLECFPKRWNFEDVRKNLKIILSNNIPFIKIKGTNYNDKKTNDYFEIDAGVADKNLIVNFVFIDNPLKLEINGKEEGILKGESISQVEPPFLKNFLCLTSYNFVYTIAYPVLVSVHDSKSDYTFQFPFVVYVNKNAPRKPVEVEIEFENVESEVCKNKLAEESVATFDSSLNPLTNVSISFKCINTVCDIGMTSLKNGQAILTEKFPQCVNGVIIGEKEGYARAKQIVSTNVDYQSINLILKPLTKLNVEVKLIDSEGNERNLKEDETALITFLNKKDDLAETLIYPEEKEVELVSGDYNIRIQVFKNKQIILEEQEVKKCFKVPIPGLSIFKVSREKCTTIKVPETKIDQLLFGGTQFNFFLNVKGKTKLILYAIENPVPESLDEVNTILTDISINKNSPLFKEPELV